MRKQKTGFFLLLVLLSFSCDLFAQSKPWRGGELRTKVSYRYGKFEVRMKSAQASGMLTTFFTYHDPFPFNASLWNEIDVEVLGRYSDQVQFNTITANEVHHVFSAELKVNPHAAFHEYAIEWTPDYVAWFFDGFEIYRQTESHVQTLSRAQKFMMNIWQPIYTDWTGTFDPNDLPLHGFYDWARYSEYTPESEDKFTLVWEDNFDAWDTSRWAKASHTFNGNNARFTGTNVNFQDGYMILSLTRPEATGYGGETIVEEDVDPPYLVWARAVEGAVYAQFSEKLDAASAENLSRYTLTGVSLEAAELQEDERVVALLSSEITPEKTYLLVAQKLKDQSGNNLEMKLQFENVSSQLIFPATINVGSEEDAEGVLTDKIWEFKQEYGGIGGALKAVPEGVEIVGAQGDPVFSSFREGLTFYQVRVPNGVWNLKLDFVETEFDQAGTRVFDVFVEGNEALSDIDIFAQAGANTAFSQNIESVLVDDGMLDVYFKSQTGKTVLAGLSVNGSPTSVHAPNHPPSAFKLSVYPNPFNPSTTIAYQVPEPGEIVIDLFNAVGQRVRRIVETRQAAGNFELLLDASSLTSGVYFVNFRFNQTPVKTQKILYLK